MEFIVGDADDISSGRGRRICSPTLADIREHICSPGEIWYGAEFSLRHPGRPDLTALCTTNACLRPGEEGEFALYLGDELVRERVSRAEIIRRFAHALSEGELPPLCPPEQ